MKLRRTIATPDAAAEAARVPASKRVTLKLYPADKSPFRTSWPAPLMRRLLGATMTATGSLMVAAEPDEVAGRMNALHSLY